MTQTPNILFTRLKPPPVPEVLLTTAKEAELDRANLYRILSGETDPRASTLVKIASSLGYRLTLVKQSFPSLQP
jgi:transcriptional regulator with XRE-family HTH domain